MADDDAYTQTLAELDSIANAAMTESEREVRAQPVLTKARITATELCTALTSPDLSWNQQKASSLGVSQQDWLLALDVAGVRACTSLGTLLGVIHRAESAAAMLRAGYTASVDDDGHLSWTH